MRHARHIVLLFAILLGAYYQSAAQKTVPLKGSVSDTSGAPVPNASVKIFINGDSIGVLTNDLGKFTTSIPANSNGSIKVTAVGFVSVVKNFEKGMEEVGVISLLPNEGLLDEVIVKAENPITVKEDTIEYKASAYKVREGSAVEEVIKKLPGVEVDNNGEIKAQGKPVTRVRVNGKDFFGGDVQTATKNLPADIIENIQIIDDYGEQAKLTGLKTGEPEKIININIQKNKNRGVFGNAGAAVGSEGRFSGGLMANYFHDERQLSFVGSINNTNASVFNFSGGGRGGGARGASFGGGGGGGGGIGITRSAGLNFRDQINKKISLYGSYSFSSSNSRAERTSFMQNFDPENTRSTFRQSSSTSTSQNHRLTLNVEYKIDTANYIKMTPYFSSGNSASTSKGNSDISRPKFRTLQDNNNSSESDTKALGGEFLFNHKFKKRGRNFSLSAMIDRSTRDQFNYVNTHYYNIDSTQSPIYERDTIQRQDILIGNENTKTSIRASYIEPIATATYLEFNYEWSNSITKNAREVTDISMLTGDKTINPNQTNFFDYGFVTHRVGLNLKGDRQKYYYLIGIATQPSLLTGESIGKGSATRYYNLNWIPTARFVYRFSKSNTMTASYSGNSREPGFMQLQPVIDSSNLNNIVIGNPNLQAELYNRFGLQYNNFNSEKGTSLFSNLSFDQTQNKIVANRINADSGTARTTSYLNTNGFYSVSGNSSYSRPFNNKKFTVSVGVSGNYGSNISYTNNLRNRGNNWSLRPNTNIRVDITDWVDAGLQASYSMNETVTKYPNRPATVSKSRTLQLGLNGRNYFFKDFILGYDVNKQFNYGWNQSVNSNPIIMNVYTEYQFWKRRASIKFQGYDLFNQNTGIDRNVGDDGSVTESRTQRLARYYLLSFSMRIYKFKGQAARSSRNEKGEGNKENTNNNNGNRNNNGGRGGNGGGGNRGGGGRSR